MLRTIIALAILVAILDLASGKIGSEDLKSEETFQITRFTLEDALPKSIKFTLGDVIPKRGKHHRRGPNDFHHDLKAGHSRQSRKHRPPPPHNGHRGPIDNHQGRRPSPPPRQFRPRPELHRPRRPAIPPHRQRTRVPRPPRNEYVPVFTTTTNFYRSNEEANQIDFEPHHEQESFIIPNFSIEFPPIEPLRFRSFGFFQDRDGPGNRENYQQPHEPRIIITEPQLVEYNFQQGPYEKVNSQQHTGYREFSDRAQHQPEPINYGVPLIEPPVSETVHYAEAASTVQEKVVENDNYTSSSQPPEQEVAHKVGKRAAKDSYFFSYYPPLPFALRNKEANDDTKLQVYEETVLRPLLVKPPPKKGDSAKVKPSE